MKQAEIAEGESWNSGTRMSRCPEVMPRPARPKWISFENGLGHAQFSGFSPPAGAANGWRCFQQKVERYTSSCAALWDDAGTATPCLGPVIPLSAKLEREAQAERQMEEIKARLRRFPRSPRDRGAWREALLNTSREMARNSLGLPEPGLQLLFNRPGLEASRRFARDAKAFDPGIADASLFQAMRNLWIVNSIQLLMDRPVCLSPAVFGYSMLYPWTDNYLDDPRVPGQSKLEFGAWFERRLRGSRAVPADTRSAQVSRLVALIERCFPRVQFEDVYLSLRAIHQAQMASLAQQQTDGSLGEPDLLRTTFRKGGTSVLADAYLVAGKLSEVEAGFMFDFGVLLQLLDDLQDLQTDLANGHATLFAAQADGWLDGVTAKLWSFAQAVLWSSHRFSAQPHHAVKALIQESCKLMMLQGVARNHGRYRPPFVSELEKYSPFRFSFLRAREPALKDESNKIISLLRQRRRLDSAFDLLS